MSMAEDSPSLKDIDFSGWMDRYVKSLLAVGIPSYLAMEGYERYMQARTQGPRGSALTESIATPRRVADGVICKCK